jgi:nitroreductase/FMN reductase [NAD(P)H]
MSTHTSTRIAAAIHRRYAEAVDVPESLPSPDALALMNERSVCRRYRADPVPPALLRLLCATALASPTKSDLQQASVVRVAPGPDRAAIDALFPGSPWIAGAPEFLVFCGDGFRLRRLFARRGREFPNEHLDAFFNATVDGAIVLSTFVQAAGLVGLGTCPISEIRNHAGDVAERLGLPDWVFPIAGLTLGWPEALEPPSPRLALRATVHDGRYDAAGVDRELDAYDERRIRERPYRRQRLAERFGVAERYGWTEDKARQYSEVQRADFGAFVQGKRYRLE